MISHNKVLDILYDSEIIYDSMDDYSEPDYSNGKPIITGDWNKISNKLYSYMELEYNLEWLDEWMSCGECYNAVRTQPDSYSWQPSYVWLSDCEVVCTNCLMDDDDLYTEWLDDFINNPDKCLNGENVNHDLLYQLGFELLDDNYKSGLHDGMNDNPTAILEKLNKYYDDVIFYNDYTSQFHITFRAYVRGDDTSQGYSSMV